MSYPNAAMNTAVSLGGILGTGAGPITTGTINTGAGVMGGTMTSHAVLNENNHVFSCTKVENGWTFTYRSKTHIASTVDEMMEQMKAAMVVERIEK